MDPKLPGFSSDAKSKNVSKSDKLYWFPAADKTKDVDLVKTKTRQTRLLTSVLESTTVVSRWFCLNPGPPP